MYRYVTGKGEREKDLNKHIREMIQVLKHEKIKKNIYIKNITLSSHAFERYNEIFEREKDIVVATRNVKELLKRAVRIGTVLSYDGRVNVLYACEKHGIYLSPDLKTIVTINKYESIIYTPITNEINEKRKKGIEFSKEELLEMHFAEIKRLEKLEEELINKVLSLEKRVTESVDIYTNLLKKRCKLNKKDIRKHISEQNYNLKVEGRKLFNIKTQKRHVCKSVVALC